jgi:hypothetical protein
MGRFQQFVPDLGLNWKTIGLPMLHDLASDPIMQASGKTHNSAQASIPLVRSITPGSTFVGWVDSTSNFFPRNVYPKDYKRLEAQLRPLKTDAVELMDGEVWVDLE